MYFQIDEIFFPIFLFSDLFVFLSRTSVLGVKRLLSVLDIGKQPRLVWVVEVSALERKSPGKTRSSLAEKKDRMLFYVRISSSMWSLGLDLRQK